MAQNKRTVILADTILKGENLTETKNRGILIEDGTIRGIVTHEEASSIQAQAGMTCRVTMIDLGDCVLLPGLFDCHNHLALDAGLKGHLDMMELPEEEHRVLAENGLRKDLLSGVTTARCMGDRYGLDLKYKQLIARGEISGPDLLACGTGMRAANGHGYVGLPHSGPGEFARTSRENIAGGADHLKIFVTPGIPAAAPDEEIPCYLSEQEVEAVVEEARAAGIHTTAHCIGGPGLELCVRKGIDVIDHLYSVTPDQVALLENEFGGWIDLTSGVVLDEEREAYTPEKQNIRMRRAREYSRECLRRLYESPHLRFTIGTDAYHGQLWKEVYYAIENGMDHRRALGAVTVNAARMTGQEHVKGQITPGYIADMIAVKKNPLREADALAEILLVMKNGNIIVNNHIPE